jgi:hypothetical protein
MHNDSCHSNEHKLAGINFLVNRIITYPMPRSEMEKEISTSQHILNANGFNLIDIMDRIKHQQRKSSYNITNSNQTPKKWASFTYTGNDMLSITRFLKKNII